MTRLLLLFIIGFSLLSCDEKRRVEYVDGKQRLNQNNTNINGDLISINLINIGTDTVIQGEELILKITTSDKDFKIVNAFFDCQVDKSSLIDTVTYKIDGCEKGFLIKSDTILIAFKHQEIGNHQFEETVIAVTKGPDSILRYHKGTFDYTVIEKNQN